MGGEKINKCPFADPRALFEDLGTLRSERDLPFSNHFNAFVVSRYVDILEVLEHPETFSSKPTVPEFPPPVVPIFDKKVPGKGTLLGWDNPDHDRLRQSVSSFFVPRRLERYEPAIRKAANELVDDFVSKGSADIKHRFALPLPLKIIAKVAGLDSARWEWIGKSLALFGGHAHFNTGTIEEKVQGILDIHQYIAQLIEERKDDRGDDLISHIWNERDAGIVEMTDLEHLGMIPGLLLAGHETTTNFLSMSLSHLLHTGLWDKINQNDDTRKQGLEELLRFESAITGMKRLVLKDTVLGGTPLKAGSEIFVAYNSGSRDESRFVEPDVVNFERTSQTQHLAFGRGMHACLGAPLARLILRVELDVLHERLPGLNLVTEYDSIQYDRIHEGRGIDSLVVAWDGSRANRVHARKDVAQQITARAANNTTTMTIQSAVLIAKEILLVTFQPLAVQTIPDWSAGAHIDIAVGELGWRQYSLCSSPDRKDVLQIAVLLEHEGLGGSRYIHREFRAGGIVRVRGPRNNFPLRPSPRYLFIAGGVGITPMKPMMEHAKRAGCGYRLVYLGRSRASMAFAADLEHEHPDRVTIWAKDEHDTSFELSTLGTEDGASLQIYACGPERLIEEVEKVFSSLPLGNVHVERFSNSGVMSRPKKPFKATLSRSGKTLDVPQDRTLLDVLRENGTTVLSTCSKGTCGTCEVRVLAGTPEHLDVVLTPLERLENKSMMVCVSRCLGTSLTLDLW